MRLKRPAASTVVLGLLCAMYLITYVDRVNISTAARDIQKELELSNTQLGILHFDGRLGMTAYALGMIVMVASLAFAVRTVLRNSE